MDKVERVSRVQWIVVKDISALGKGLGAIMYI